MTEGAQSDANKVRGCASQVWLETIARSDHSNDIRLDFRGDSDAHIVRGLVYIIIAFFSGRTAQDILDANPLELFTKLGLDEHLTPQRSNGVRAMVERMRADARGALQQVQ